MQISILGYGDECRGMAALCAASIVKLGHPASQVSIWSDDCNWFREQGYAVRELSDTLIKDWKGPYGFSLRLKILMMREVLENAPSDVQLFSDADIYWRKLPDTSILEEGTTALMYACEANFNAESMERYNRAVAEVYPGKPIQMYNSGVLGFPRGFLLHEFDRILRTCDHICDLLPRNLGLAEQVAYTASFIRNYRVKTVDDDAYHYLTFNNEIAVLMRDRTLNEWANTTFAELEELNRRAERLFYSPFYRWQNRLQKLKRSWKKTRNQQLAKRRRAANHP